MVEAGTSVVQEKLDQLCTELVDLAFNLERRGRLDAADVAIATSARVKELREELAVAGTTVKRTSEEPLR